MIPLMFIFAHFIGLDGVWFSMPVGEILAGLWAGTWLYLEVNKMNKSAKGIAP